MDVTVDNVDVADSVIGHTSTASTSPPTRGDDLARRLPILRPQTDYVLLDEPLNNLELRHAVAMMRLLRRMADETSRAGRARHQRRVGPFRPDRRMRDGVVVAGDRIGVYYR